MAYQKITEPSEEWHGAQAIEYQSGDQKFILAVSYRDPRAFEQFSSEFRQNVEKGTAFIRAVYDSTAYQSKPKQSNGAEDGIEGPGNWEEPDPAPGDLEIRILQVGDEEKKGLQAIEFSFGEITLGSTHYFWSLATRGDVSVSFAGGAGRASLSPNGVSRRSSGGLTYPPYSQPSLAQAVQFSVRVTGSAGVTYTVSGTYVWASGTF